MRPNNPRPNNPRPNTARLLAAIALAGCALLGACKSDEPNNPVLPVDAAVAGPDLRCVEQACVAENNEDCGACMRHIGECCYKDKAWTSTPALVNTLANTCSDIPTCAACCNECVAMACDELVKRGNCPYDL